MYFKASPEIIRLAVMLYVRFPLALRNVEDLQRKRGQPEVIGTDRLRSYGAAMKKIGGIGRQVTGRWLNSRAENSHLSF